MTARPLFAPSARSCSGPVSCRSIWSKNWNSWPSCLPGKPLTRGACLLDDSTQGSRHQGPGTAAWPGRQPLGRSQGRPVFLLYSTFSPRTLQPNGDAFPFLRYFRRWEESDPSSGLSLKRAQEELERDGPLPWALHCHAKPQGRVAEAGSGPGSLTRRAASCCHPGE